MKKKDLYLWIDNFQRGGLEKSVYEMYCDLENKKFFTKVFICTLESSRSCITDYFKFNEKVKFKFFRNHTTAFFELRKFLKSGNIVLSFRNHIFLVLFLFFTFTKLRNLFLRHVSSLLASTCFQRYKYKKSNLFGLFKERLRFFIQNIVYSLVPNHICNSLENLLLLEVFIMQNVYCYTNPSYLKHHSDDLSLNAEYSCNKNFKTIWFARFSPFKDINVLLNSLPKVDLLNRKIQLDIFTSDKQSLEKYLRKSYKFKFKNINLRINDWSNNLQINLYDLVIITSFYEGLSNSFMEAVSNKKLIIAPLTSSGFIENLSSNVYLYRPGNSNSFLFAFKQLIKDAKNQSSRKELINQYLFNQDFYRKISSN